MMLYFLLILQSSLYPFKNIEKIKMEKGKPELICKRSPKATGGPDAFGYRWIDSDEPGGPTYNWIEISGTGTNAGITGDDQNAGPFPIGFSFPFYGDTFTTFRICSNGWISFTSTSTQYSNTSLPNTGAPYDLIAPFWDDLYPPDGGDVYYDNTRPGTLIVEFDQIWHINGSGTYTFEVILLEDGTIIFQYNSMNGTLNSATIGIQNSDGTIGLEVAYNTAYVYNGLAVKICLPYGALSGYVYDIADSTPIQGAVVSVKGTSKQDTTDTNGAYFIGSIAIGEHTFICYKNGYGREQIIDSIKENDTTLIDFYLSSPEIKAIPESLSVLVEVGATLEDSVFIINEGTGYLNYNISKFIVTSKWDTIFFDDMESGENGWTHFDWGWVGDYWHQVNSHLWVSPPYHSSSTAWWCGDDATGFYLNNLDNGLFTPWISLPAGCDSIELSFWEYYSTESGCDYCDLWIWDGSNWYFLRSVDGSSGGWQSTEFNLLPYAGLDIQILFYFYSDGSIVDEGWFIDDVMIQAFKLDTVETLPDFLWVEPSESTVWQGDTQIVQIIFDATDKCPDSTYKDTFYIYSNDVDSQDTCKPVAVTMHVFDSTSPQIEQVTIWQDTNYMGPFLVVAHVKDNYKPWRVWLYYKTKGIDWTPLLMEESGTNRYKQSIPAQSDTATIYYYIFAQDYSNNVSYKPTGAPGEYYQFKLLGINETIALPTRYELSLLNNPVLKYAKIKYGVPHASKVDILLYDVTGRLVKKLLSRNLQPGYYELNLQAEEYSAGVYFVVLSSEDKKLLRKFVIVK